MTSDTNPHLESINPPNPHRSISCCSCIQATTQAYKPCANHSSSPVNEILHYLIVQPIHHTVLQRSSTSSKPTTASHLHYDQAGCGMSNSNFLSSTTNDCPILPRGGGTQRACVCVQATTLQPIELTEGLHHQLISWTTSQQQGTPQVTTREYCTQLPHTHPHPPPELQPGPG